VTFNAEVDVNFFEALKYAAQEQQDSGIARIHDWFMFIEGIDVALNFRNSTELLATKSAEKWWGDDDRGALFNPIANYATLVQAAVKNSPTALILAHLPPIVHKLCDTIFNSIDSVTGINGFSPSFAVRAEIISPGIIPTIKKVLGFDASWPVWKNVNEKLLGEILNIVDVNGNGLIPLDEAELYCAVLEQLDEHQAASDIRDLYLENEGNKNLEVPSAIFAIPVSMAAFMVARRELDKAEDGTAIRGDLTPEQLAVGFGILKQQLQALVNSNSAS